MAEITWIKLRTNMFDDEKIKLLERLPDGDMVIVVWIKLLAQAGKVNCGGYIMIAENIPMSLDEMSVIFNKTNQQINYALTALQRYGMIEIDEESTIFISNWEKHQNIDGMEKIRIQNAERQRKYREKKKVKELPYSENSHSNVTHNVTVTEDNAIDIEKEKEKEKEKDVSNIQVVVNILKSSSNIPRFIKLTDKRKASIKARLNEHGIDKVIDAISKIQESDFFKDAKDNKKSWYDLDWIFNPNNFVKILEDKYINKTNNYSLNNNTNSYQGASVQKDVKVEDLYNGGEW